MKIWVTGYRIIGFSLVGIILISIAIGFLFSNPGSEHHGHSLSELGVALLFGSIGSSSIAYALYSNIAITNNRGIATAKSGFIAWDSCRGYRWENFHGAWMSSDYIALIVRADEMNRIEKISQVATSPFGRSKVKALVDLIESNGIERTQYLRSSIN